MIPRRWSVGALVLFAVVAVLSGWVYGSNLAWPVSPLWSSGLMNLGVWFMLLPSVLSGWASWQGWRQRRLGPTRSAAVRSPAEVALDWYKPALITCLVGPIGAVIWMAPHLLGRPRPMDLVLIPVASAALLVWTVIGALLGRLLPIPIALATAVVVPFLGTAFPEAQSSVTYRHVLAQHSSCCLIDTEVAPRVLLGAALFHAALLVALVWALLRVSWVRFGAALVVGALVFQISASIVRPVDSPDGVRPRPVSALVCEQGNPTLCLWPEQNAERAFLRKSAEQISGALKRSGITVPNLVSADPTADWDYVLGVSGESDDHRRSVLIEGLVSVSMPACAKREPWLMPAAFDDMSNWVWLRAGFPASGVRISPRLAKVLARPETDQNDWFRANMAQRSQCRVKPIP